MYADDLLLLWLTESEALAMWILLQAWNGDNLMRLKLSECSYVTLGERCLLLENQGLSLQLSHKHLGVFLTARGFERRSQVEHTVKDFYLPDYPICCTAYGGSLQQIIS